MALSIYATSAVIHCGLCIAGRSWDLVYNKGTQAARRYITQYFSERVICQLIRLKLDWPRFLVGCEDVCYA